MNRKGFTLVELIASIAIMLLITAIAVPSVISILNRSEDKLDSATKKQLISYAKSYIKDNNYSIEEGKTYCILINDLTDEELKDSDDKTIEGRIEIKKENDKINYSYSDNNSKNGCEKFNNNVNLNNDKITLNSNSEANVDKDSLLGKIIDKYEIMPGIPDFYNKSPKDAADNFAGGTYKIYESKLSSEDMSELGMVTYYPCASSSWKMDGIRSEVPDLEHCKLKGGGNSQIYPYPNGESGKINFFMYLNTKAYFSNDYEFDASKGEYTLKNASLEYMFEADEKINGGNTSEDKPLYACRSTTSSTCKKLYKITGYSSTFAWNNPYHGSIGYYTSDLRARQDTITSGSVLYSIRNIDKSDSGLYRYIDDDGITYYFRGAISENYVKIGENLFQIIRFNGDGTIRLMSVEPINEQITLGNTDNSKYYNGSFNVPKFSIYEYYEYNNTQNISFTETATWSRNFRDYVCNNKTGDKMVYDSYTNSVTTNPYTRGDFSLKGENSIDLSSCIGNNTCIGKFFQNDLTKSTGKTHIIRKITSVTRTNNDNETCIDKTTGKSRKRYNYVVKYKSISLKSTSSDSVLKSKLQNWYENKMQKYSGIISDGNFCMENKFANSYTETYNGSADYIAIDTLYPGDYTCYPTLSCVNGIKTSTKVGLITADESIFAGISVETSNENFLSRKNNYLTFTNVKSPGDNYGTIYTINYNSPGDRIKSSYLFSNENFYLYPVINISGDVKTTGNGTNDNPYVVDYQFTKNEEQIQIGE